MRKSTVEEIRERFDASVERFSNLETGHVAAMDAVLCLELVARAAAGVTPAANQVLDIGCGAGNFTLRLRQELAFSHVTLLDLSQPMLDRANQRLNAAGIECQAVQTDVREAAFAPESFDVILAGAVLHHLRHEAEWRDTFGKLHTWLRPAGSLWIFDLVSHETPFVEQMQLGRYEEYLRGHGGEDYAAMVMRYTEKEDSPRPVTWQLELLRESGFSSVELLHKNAAFAAFGAIKAAEPSPPRNT